MLKREREREAVSNPYSAAGVRFYVPNTLIVVEGTTCTGNVRWCFKLPQYAAARTHLSGENCCGC